jgi:multiple sugar transport system ATP-binding protein
MSMADLIAIMNNGAVEQLGSPQEIYDCPATTFVADFVGSPAMNLIQVSDRLGKGGKAVTLSGARIPIPEMREDAPNEALVLGARPEHIRFDDGSAYRGEIFGTEYLGTMQIVTVKTAQGRIKVKVPARVAVNAGDQVGLAFLGDRLSIFDKGTGRALRSALHDGVGHG